MTPEYKLVVWQQPNGLVFQEIRAFPFMAFSAGDRLDMLGGNSADWLVESVSHSIYGDSAKQGHQVTLHVRPA